MDKFQKYKKDIVSGLNIAIILAAISLIGNFFVDARFSNLNLKTLLAYIIVAGVALGLLFWARESAKKEKLLGGILTLIVGIIMFFAGGLIDEILGAVFIVMAIAYFIAYSKYKK